MARRRPYAPRPQPDADSRAALSARIQTAPAICERHPAKQQRCGRHRAGLVRSALARARAGRRPESARGTFPDGAQPGAQSHAQCPRPHVRRRTGRRRRQLRAADQDGGRRVDRRGRSHGLPRFDGCFAGALPRSLRAARGRRTLLQGNGEGDAPFRQHDRKAYWQGQADLPLAPRGSEAQSQRRGCGAECRRPTQRIVSDRRGISGGSPEEHMTYIPEIETLADVPRHHAKTRPDAVALIDGERVTTYRTFDERCSRVANGLLALGVKPGARIAAMDQNSDRYFEILFGVAKIGAVRVSVNWRLAPPEIAYILNDARAEIIFIGEQFAGLLEAARGELKHLKHVIVTDGAAKGWPGYEAWLAKQSSVDPGYRGSAKDTVVQMYTSGTTGHPKGVELSHFAHYAHERNRAANPDDPQMAWNDWTNSDTSLVTMPTFHVSGTCW